MEKLLLRVREVSEIIGLGKSKTYELVSSGELPSVRVGRSVRISTAALKAWVAAKCAEAGQPDGRAS